MSNQMNGQARVEEKATKQKTRAAEKTQKQKTRAAEKSNDKKIIHGSNGSGAGKLIICPTPIGNLGDITRRCADALENADVIFAEDTRVTGKLLAALNIQNRLERLDEAKMQSRADGVVARAAAGQIIAYCTDAGMPGVSDPGLRLVAAAREAGVPVEVLPGASALTTAYVASGFACARFYFHGFFPRRTGEQIKLLDQLKNLDACLIFYESPKRVVAALETITQKLPLRRVCVCRELTKLHEEVAIGSAQELFEIFGAREQETAIKGEIVIVIDAPNSQERAQGTTDTENKAKTRAQELTQQGARTSEIVKTLTREFNIPRNTAYTIALSKNEKTQVSL